ncbi:MAG: AraC family transcriptional regulator [Bacteroidota bacterium]|nr:AraC family transcriptional regulator [Bacteroidota bacterium]
MLQKINYFHQNNRLPFYKTYRPSPTLSKLIHELQVYHVKWDGEENLPKPFITCLANTEQNLYFYLNDPVKAVPAMQVEITCPPVIVTGPKYKPTGLLFGKDHLMIKVAFHPTGTYRLLGIHMQHTVNKGLDAEEIWGREVNDIVNQLRPAPTYDAMIEIVLSFLERKSDSACRPEEPIDTVAIQMQDPLNNHSLEEWAALACLSLRQFERNFITRVGISPKLFIRIVRFEHAMKIKKSYPGKSWAGIALECGYTDSSHLLREFREFAEFPPSRFYLQPTSGYSDFSTG